MASGAAVRNALMFVPLHEEMRYVHQHLTGVRNAHCHTGNYTTANDFYLFEMNRGTAHAYYLYCQVIGDMGNLRTATAVLDKLGDLESSICFLVGMAGSLAPDVCQLGDVVVSYEVKAMYADKVKRRDPRKEVFAPDVATGSQVVLDPRKKLLTDSYLRYRRDYVRWMTSAGLAAQYLNFARQNAPGLTTVDRSRVPKLDRSLEHMNPEPMQGVILGSELVIDCQEFVDFLQHRNRTTLDDVYAGARGKWFDSDILAVDMESYGFFKAVEAGFRANGTSLALAVRGISDLAAKKTGLETSSKNAVRNIATINAVQTTLHILEFASGARIF